MVSPDTSTPEYREMTLADLEAVLKIESRAYTFPWSRGIFADCLMAGHCCRVCSIEGRVVGHAVLSAAAGEAHLLNICVQRDQQSRGIGRAFVHHMLHKAKLLGAETLFLEVRPSNTTALALYDSLGFLQVGTRKDYYPAALGREDAFVLALRLD